MADETTLRLRIEGDTSGLVAGLAKGETELQKFATEAKQASNELTQVGATASLAATKMEAAAVTGSAGFGKLAGAFTVAQVGANALLEVADKLTRSLAAPITEILDAEQAAAMLKGTFGDLTGEMESVATLASQLGSQNAFFDDDALTQGAATLKLFGANSEAIKQLLPYVNNLAIAFGVDVNDAAQMVGQALMGNTRALGKMVPEVRGANSQLEVLSALQSSAARNATIAQERTSGLGGQLALLKRQLADAAQGWGQIMLPAMTAVLGFVNQYLLPGIGKVMGAIAAMGAALGALAGGGGFQDIKRLAGEAFRETESMFKGVQAKVTAVPVVPRVVAGGLSLKGSFGGGDTGAGGAAGTSRRSAAAAVVPFSQRLEIYAIDPDTVKQMERERQSWERAKEGWARETEQAAKFATDAAREIEAIQDENYKKNVADYKTIAQGFGDTLTKVIEGDFSGALTASLNGGAKVLQDIVSSAAPDLRRELGDGIAGVVEAAAPAALGIVAKLVDLAARNVVGPLISAMTGADEAARKSAGAKITAEFNAALALQEAARAQEMATAQATQFQAAQQARQNREAMAANQSLREATLRGPGAALVESLRQEIVGLGGTLGGMAILGDVINKLGSLSASDLGGIAKAARTSISGTGPDQLAAYQQLAAFGIDVATAGGREIALRLAESVDKLGVVGQTAETINDGSSPDRPVYVFDVRPRDSFAFAPESFFFRNRGAGTSRGVSSGTPLGLPKAKAIRPGSLG
jgi:hypothetical protein